MPGSDRLTSLTEISQGFDLSGEGMMRRVILMIAAALLPITVMSGPASAASSSVAASLPQPKFTLYEHLSHFREIDTFTVTSQGTLHVGGRHGPIVGTEFKYCVDSFCETRVTMFSPEFGEGTFITLGFYSGATEIRLKAVDGTGDFAAVRGHVRDKFLSRTLHRLEFDLRVRA